MLGSTMCRLRFALVFSIVAAANCLGVGTERGRFEPITRHRQEAGGLTVQIEKVTIERIFNEPGYMDGSDETWDKVTPNHPSQSWRSFRVIRVFLSVSGAVSDVEQWIAPIVTFAKAPKGKYKGIALFEPPSWQRKMDLIKIAPEAMGFAHFIHLSKEDDPHTLFPLTIALKLGLKGGREVNLTFKDVRM